MDDKELDKLFGDNAEADSSDEKEDSKAEQHEEEKETAPEEEAAVTVESSDEDNALSPDEIADEDAGDESDAKKIVKTAAQTEDEILEEKIKRKNQKKIDNIRRIEQLEDKIEQRKEERKRKREEAIPLRDRVYLEDFPLSFKTTAIILLVMTLVTVVVTIAFNPFFRVSSIAVNGNYELSDDEVLDALGIQYNDHLFSLYFSGSRQLISTNPYIEDVSVRRIFPSALEINVVERKKIAYISTPDGYIAIDSEGIVLEFSSDRSVEVSPLLCGVDINSAVIGCKVDVLQDNSFRKMIMVLSAALSAGEIYDGDDYSFFDSIKEVRIVSSGMLFITVTLPEGTDLQVKLKDISTISDDMHWLVYAIEENSFVGLPDGVLDMTGDEYIYREYGY